jgi:hypothetical protein
MGVLTQSWRGRLADRLGMARHPLLLRNIQVLGTFHLVLFSWVFFRSNSLADALGFLSAISHVDLGALLHPMALFNSLSSVGLGRVGLPIAFASIAFMEAIHLVQHHGRIRHMLSDKPVWFRWGVCYAMILMIIMFGVYSNEQFIYFQF